MKLKRRKFLEVGEREREMEGKEEKVAGVERRNFWWWCWWSDAVVVERKVIACWRRRRRRGTLVERMLEDKVNFVIGMRTKTFLLF